MKLKKTHVTLFLVTTYLCLTFFHTSKSYQTTSTVEEKPIAVIIPSYNNKNWYKRNLKSIFQQEYDNYRIIYINDASPDKTGNLVAQYVKKFGQEHRFTLIDNQKNCGAMANLYKAIHTCNDSEIVVTIDGDDWLLGKKVFKLLNNTYNDPNVWMTYGQYTTIYCSGKNEEILTKKGHCRQIPANIIRAHGYRETDWVSSHLRTFYAGLFKQIELKDFLENGRFYDVSWDMAFMLPMLEMVNGKFKFIDNVIYGYNCITLLNDHKNKLQKQIHTANVIKSKKKYNPIASPYKKKSIEKTTDMILFAQGNEKRLHSLLSSIRTNIQAIGDICVLCKDDIPQPEDLMFENVFFVPISEDDNLKYIFECVLSQSNLKYIVIAKDNIAITDTIDIKKCIDIMEQTCAYGFYFSMGNNLQDKHIVAKQVPIPPYSYITNNICAWQFKNGEYAWQKPHNFSMAMYKKEDILRYVKNINYNSLQYLETYINLQWFDLENVGLFFVKPKIKVINETQK